VRIAQLALTFLGHRPGGVDGLFGNNTRKALQRFQAAAGMPQTTELTPAAFDALIEKAFGGDIDD
jgi:peptidoglycan hydrolase-like protein with peptidoglycan-binding domain